MKKISYVFIIRIAAIVLMLAALVAACFGSIQSSKAFLMPIGFRGEYSIDGGGTWQTLPESPDISWEHSSVILKGGFGEEVPEGTHFNFYLDHITMEIFINGEQYLWDSANEIGLTSSTCGKKWSHWISPQISEEDVIELRLGHFHKFGNKNAYNELLGNIYGGTEAMFESFMLEKGKASRIIGTAVIVAAIMLLAAAMFFGLMHIDGGVTAGNLGAFALFFGGYIILDTIDLPLWSWYFSFNTYALQLCIMLGATCGAACIAENLRLKAADIAVIASGAVSSVLALLSIFKVMVIYDTQLIWLLAHILIYGVLLGCCIYRCVCKRVTDRLAIISNFLIIIAAFADMACYFSGMSNAGICSKCVFLILLLIHFVRIIRVITMNYKAAREAEQLRAELSEHRIAAMISRIKPHFIYNTLGSICQLCIEQPEKAAELTRDFSQYLRGNFSELENSRPILLSKELEHVKHYVSIEQVRFPDITVDIDVRCDNFFLPALSVQPLVENAIKHGLMGLESGGRVTVCAYETDREYCVKVSDNGVGFDVNAQPDDDRHIGIKNIRERISAICGGRLTVESTPGRGTTAVIYIPKEEK